MTEMESIVYGTYLYFSDWLRKPGGPDLHSAQWFRETSTSEWGMGEITVERNNIVIGTIKIRNDGVSAVFQSHGPSQLKYSSEWTNPNLFEEVKEFFEHNP